MLISNAQQIFSSAIQYHQILHFRDNFKEKWLSTLLGSLLRETEIFHRMLEFQNTLHLIVLWY
jgi:hypothetical protein